jgi:YHS domain-containing protein
MVPVKKLIVNITTPNTLKRNCKSCLQPISALHDYVACNTCLAYYHIKCVLKTEKAIKKSSVKPQTVWFCTKECEEKTSSPQNYVHANKEASNNCTQDNISHADLLAAIQDMG